MRSSAAAAAAAASAAHCLLPPSLVSLPATHQRLSGAPALGGGVCNKKRRAFHDWGCDPALQITRHAWAALIKI